MVGSGVSELGVDPNGADVIVGSRVPGVGSRADGPPVEATMVGSRLSVIGGDGGLPPPWKDGLVEAESPVGGCVSGGIGGWSVGSGDGLSVGCVVGSLVGRMERTG